MLKSLFSPPKKAEKNNIPSWRWTGIAHDVGGTLVFPDGQVVQSEYDRIGNFTTAGFAVVKKGAGYGIVYYDSVAKVLKEHLAPIAATIQLTLDGKALVWVSKDVHTTLYLKGQCTLEKEYTDPKELEDDLLRLLQP